MASLRLRREPTVHQVEVILRRIEDALGSRGAGVSRGPRGDIRFRIVPWRSPKLSMLLLVTSGHARVSAGQGEPRRLRYGLDFTALHAVGAALSMLIVIGGWSWPRLMLINTLFVLWAVLLGLRIAAVRRFRALLGDAAREIVERRETPREEPEQSG